MAEWMRVSRSLRRDADSARRANAATVMQGLDGAAVLLVKRGGTVSEYVWGDAEAVGRAGRLAGFAVAECDEPELPERIVLRHALVPKFGVELNSIGAVERNQMSLEETRRMVEESMPDDSYVSYRFRRQGRVAEARRVLDWIADQADGADDASLLRRDGTMVARITAGAPSDRDARSVLSAAAHSVNPLMNRTDGSHRSLPRFGWLLLAVLLTAAAGAAVYLKPMPWTWLPLILSVILLGLAGWRWRGRNPFDDITQAPHHKLTRGHHRSARRDKQTSIGEDEDKRRSQDYPLHRSSFLCPAVYAAAVVTPSGGSGAAVQEQHLLPVELESPDVRLGEDMAGNPAGLRSGQLYKGIAVMGQAGTGKTVLVHGVLHWALQAMRGGKGRAFGSDSRVIDFETKDAASGILLDRWAQAHGLPTAWEIRCADPASIQLDVLGYYDGLDAKTTGEAVAAGMRYSFEPGAILDKSQRQLADAFCAGIGVCRFEERHPGEAWMMMRRSVALFRDAERASQPVSPVGWAVLALGGSMGEMGAARMMERGLEALAEAHPDDGDVAAAADAVRSLTGGSDGKGRSVRPDNQVLTDTAAARNKAQALMAAEWLFKPGQAKVSWHQVLQRPGFYRILLAPYEGRGLDGSLDRILGAWLMWGLWRAVSRDCQNWDGLGRRTMLACDELSMLASADSRVLAGVREQGRSFGVVPVFATQYPEQLPDQLRNSFLGYGTLVSYSLGNADTAEQVARLMTDNQGEDGWTAAAIRNLPQYTAAVRTYTARQLQPAFLVRVDDFDRL